MGSYLCGEVLLEVVPENSRQIIRISETANDVSVGIA
jgi:hypothetical protein